VTGGGSARGVTGMVDGAIKHTEEHKERPRLLYKYLPMNTRIKRCRLFRIIRECKIYHPNPSTFNDPFDCRVPPVASFDPCFVRYLIEAQNATDDQRQREVYEKFIAARPRTSEELCRLSMELSLEEREQFEAAKKRIQHKVDSSTVLCLCAVCDNILMWSHYADNHRGVCLEFSLENWDEMNKAILPVCYAARRPLLRLDQQNFDKGQLIHAIALTKDRSWCYEREWRALGATRGKYKFPVEALVGIIFGCATSDADKACLRRMAADRAQIKFYQATKKEREFGLDITPC